MDVTHGFPRSLWIWAGKSRMTKFGHGGATTSATGPENAVAAVHDREIVLVRQRFWVIFDVVEGSGEHLIESRFQFAPGEVALDETTARTAFPDANLLLRAVGSVAFDHAHIEKGQGRPRSGWYSDSYGKIEPAPALSLSVRANLPWRAATLLFPYRGIVVPQATFTSQPGAAEVEHPDTGQVTVKCSLP